VAVQAQKFGGGRNRGAREKSMIYIITRWRVNVVGFEFLSQQDEVNVKKLDLFSILRFIVYSFDNK